MVNANEFYAFVVMPIAFSFIMYAVAKKRNRNPYLAIGLGMMFHIFTLLGYLIAGKKRENDK